MQDFVHQQYRSYTIWRSTSTVRYSLKLPNSNRRQVMFNLADFTQRAYGTNYVDTCRRLFDHGCLNT